MALSTVFIKGKVALDAPDQLTNRIQRSLWNPGLITQGVQRLIVEDTEAGQAARVYLFSFWAGMTEIQVGHRSIPRG